MFENILIAIWKGTFDQLKIAQEMNVSQDMLKAALEQLHVTGYLQNEIVSHGGCRHKTCEGCTGRPGCQAITIYKLTEKGKRMAEALVKR